MPDSGIQPHIALVTGGARGIGRAIVETLASDGHRIAIGDILDGEAAEVASMVRGLPIHLDVSDTGSVDHAVGRVERELGPIDILVNNAGWDEFRPFVEDRRDAVGSRDRDGFQGCLRMSHRVVPGMVERGYGRVVNIGSDAARVGSSLEAVYSGAKGAVISFTKALAREVARHGVTANAACPGPTETALLAQMAGAGEAAARTRDALRRAVPMRRLGQPRDVASAVAFLASDGAGFITGQTLSASGGLTMA